MDGQDATRVGRRAAGTPHAAPRAAAVERRLTTEVVRDEAALQALRLDWDALHLASGATQGASFNPFTSWSWTWAWWRSRTAGRPWSQPRYRLHVVVLRDEAGGVRAIFPFVRARWGLGPLSIRGLRAFGFGTNTADLRGPLVSPGWERIVADGLQDSLRSAAIAGVEMTLIDGLAEGDPFTEQLDARLRSEGWSWGPDVPSHTLTLPATWEAFRAGTKGHLKKSIRHSYNSLAREGRDWAFEMVDDPVALPEAIKDVFRLHAARAARDLEPRHKDYYARRSDRVAIRSVAGAMSTDGSFAVARLRIEGQVVAARFVFPARDTIYLHDAGADPAWARYAVATTLTAECLRWGIEHGATMAFLGTGVDPSKARWGGRQRNLRRLQIVGPTLRGRLLDAALRFRRVARGLPVALVSLDLPVEAIPAGILL